jgi:hypothetical protein
MKGSDVLAVQQRLTMLGFSPGKEDSDYGPATAAAVQRFQTSIGIEPNGVVTDAVYDLLQVVPPQPTGMPVSGVGVRALVKAISLLGVAESPPGSNKTQFGEWFGVNGVAWCNIFVSYCFNVGADYTICSGFKGMGVKVGKGCAYVPTTEAWLRATGLWVGRTNPMPGDIAIYNWDKVGVPEHIGIVEVYAGDERFSAIEGNTSVANDSNGGTVMRRTRRLDQVDGFGRIT